MQSARSWLDLRCRRALPLLGALFAALAVASLGAAALADIVTFAPAGEHLSVQLPANPDRKDTESEGTKIREWTATDNGFFYLVQHGVHPGAVFAPSQMQADLNDFVTSTKCTVSTQQNATVPGPDGPLPALRFSFKMPSGAPGEGLWTIMGDEAFGALILDQSKAGRQQQMDAFIVSLRVTK
jgi:hypothetical protein